MKMKLFEGKSPAERNKIIAASVLGAMAILALSYTFILPMFSSRKTSVTVTASPTPTAAPRGTTQTAATMPTQEEEFLLYTTTPIVYEPGNFYAPDAGRNIFAFYEPPVPTPYSPTPTPPPPPFVEPPTPTPTPLPPQLIGFVTPQSVYAGQPTFRVEVNGDQFTPDTMIYLNGAQLPTTYISPQKLVAEVPSNFISSAGSLMIMVRTPDGALYSNQVAINVQAPPTPQFQYYGVVTRQKSNNDTAYFLETGKQNPTPARLNDLVGGRFRLISISATETIFEDKDLGFKHRVALTRPQPGQGGTTNPNNQTPPARIPLKGGNMIQQNPTLYPSNPQPPQPPQPQTLDPNNCPPGIPCNTTPVYVATPPPRNEKDEDGDGR